MPPFENAPAAARVPVEVEAAELAAAAAAATAAAVLVLPGSIGLMPATMPALPLPLLMPAVVPLLAVDEAVVAEEEEGLLPPMMARASESEGICWPNCCR